jgi:hypothetical protein
MLTRAAAVLLLLAGTTPVVSHAQTRATTTDGKGVILNSDGTWRYVDAPGGADTPRKGKATAFIAGSRVRYRVWYDPAKWQASKIKANNAAEHEMTHTNGDGFALVIAERTQIPLDKFKELVLQRFATTLTDVKLVSSTERIVNGVHVGIMEVTGTTMSGIPVAYYGSYFSGKQGVVQVLTYSGQGLFEEYRADFTEFMGGLSVE